MHSHPFKTLSARLSTRVVAVVAVILMAAMLIISYYSRKALMQEALQKTDMTLQGALQHVGNTLDDVERASALMLGYIEHNLDKPEQMPLCARHMLEANPGLVGCAIAFEPGYYSGSDSCLISFAYLKPNRTEADKDSIVMAGNMEQRSHTEQEWYAMVVKQNRAGWRRPFNDDRPGATGQVTTFGMPIHSQQGKTVGVLAVGVSMEWFARFVQQAKPYPRSFCTVMGRSGNLMVFPSTDPDKQVKAINGTKMTNVADVQTLTKTMMAAAHGYTKVKLSGEDYYVFYSHLDDMGWSVAVVCQEDDVLASYNEVSTFTIGIALLAIILLSIVCFFVIKRQMSPLATLAHSARRIAEGHYDKPIAYSRRRDEVGQLQNSFHAMQMSLSNFMAETEQQATNLKQRNLELQQANEHMMETERVKTAFFTSMTDQMAAPVRNIISSVDFIQENYNTMSPEVGENIVEQMLHDANHAGEILNQLIENSLKKEP
ncbi:MAG: methyl-accepting chemotaxis protein [Prevotella sp.]|nr:methyl-accepting chemotaxis protein [Prevotella sp.]